MGTNFYYCKEPTKPPCEKCGRPFPDESKHIGKSSVGWCFALHVYPEEGINTLGDWINIWKSKEFGEDCIKNEYDHNIIVDEMIDIITNRSWDRKEPPSQKFLDDNYAIEGPNGLLRCKLISNHCIGHGNGTYDLYIGDFS